MNKMRLIGRKSLLMGAVVLLVGCATQQVLLGDAPCALAKFEVADATTHDILPGVESNLRMQRLYRLTAAAAERLPAGGTWELAVDSVGIPMRFRVDEHGEGQWSGSRNFYQAVRAGVMTLDEEGPSALGRLLPEGEAYLIHRSSDQCMAVRLPAFRHLGTEAMP